MNTLEQRLLIDKRRIRSQMLLSEILHIVGKYISDDDRRRNAERELAYELGDKLFERGVEIITDEDRRVAGLLPRGPEGWTMAELAALEAKRLELIYAPMPPMVFPPER